MVRGKRRRRAFGWTRGERTPSNRRAGSLRALPPEEKKLKAET
jgi:hypothetical protein